MVLAVTIFPDKSLFSVVAVFMILFLALKWVLFQPLFRILEERARRTDGVMAESGKTLERHQALLGQYEESVRQARLASYQKLEEKRSEALKAAAGRIQEARRQSEVMLQEAQRSLQREIEQAKNGLAADATVLAGMITQVLLQKSPPFHPSEEPKP